MHIADAQNNLRGGWRPKGREYVLCVNFSCLALKCEFLFHQAKSGQLPVFANKVLLRHICSFIHCIWLLLLKW